MDRTHFVFGLSVALIVLSNSLVVFAATCTKCGKQLKWGFGTCAECKAKALEKAKKAVDGSVNYCEECGKELKMGIGTCWECKQKKLGAAGEALKEGSREAIDNFAEGVGKTIGKGVVAYEETQKPEWQKFVESTEGIALIAGGGGILLLMIVVGFVRKASPQK